MAEEEFNSATIEQFKLALANELADLERLSDETQESRAPVILDQQSVGRLSRMDAIQGQALAQEANRRRVVRRHAIDAALTRLNSGEFGYCTTCGEPIAVRRLEIDPATANCIKCASGTEA